MMTRLYVWLKTVAVDDDGLVDVRDKARQRVIFNANLLDFRHKYPYQLNLDLTIVLQSKWEN